MSNPRVVVVGGGVAGLLAALQLRDLGIEVVLLEASASVGGVIRTVHRDGWIAESGPNTLAEPDPAVRTLLDATGLASRTLRADPRNARRFLVHQGKLVAVPKSVGELISWPVLSTAGRMRLLKEPFIKAAPSGIEESVDAFVRRRLGEEMAERVFDPLIGGASAGDPTQVLMRYAFPRLVEWEQAGGSLLRGSMRVGMEARRKAGKGRSAPGGVWSCPEGLAEIPFHIAERLGGIVRSGITVSAIEPCGREYDVVTLEGQRERVQGVVLATPAAAFRTLRVGVSGADVLSEIAAAPHASLATVSLGFRRADVAHALDGYGLLAPSAERRNLLGTLFVSSLFAGRTPDDHVLLTSFIGGARREDLVGRPEGELVDLVSRELRDLVGTTAPSVFQSVARWPSSQPQAVAGHGARLAGVAALEAECRGLVFAGGWRDGLALGEAMRCGRTAAVRLAVGMGWAGAEATPA
ncbi:MAG: protoporphyrinogen oxidase [Gemmatimonadales bacterium]